MVRVSLMYQNQTGATFDIGYYLNVYIPQLQQLLGPALKGIFVDDGIWGEQSGSAPPFIVMGHLLFDSISSYQSSFGPHAQQIMSDVPKYTKCKAIVQISEVKR